MECPGVTSVPIKFQGGKFGDLFKTKFTKVSLFNPYPFFMYRLSSCCFCQAVCKFSWFSLLFYFISVCLSFTYYLLSRLFGSMLINSLVILELMLVLLFVFVFI